MNGKEARQIPTLLIHQFMVDEDYIPTFGIQMKEGRNFDLSHPTDSGSFILNEAAVRMMGLKEPVGKWFSIGRERHHHWCDERF